MDLFSHIQPDISTITQTALQKIGQFIPENEVEHYCNDLKSIINYYDKKYYVDADSPISDYDYDILFKQLKELEEAYPNLITADSPTQRVAKGLNETFQTVQHLVPMMSLENSYNIQDLREFERKVKESVATNEKIEYICEPKFDGSSIALVYENNQLVRAATRGNGIEGDDITPNAKAIKSIPLKANFSQFGIHKIEIRGEVVMQLAVLEQLNKERLEQNIILKNENKKELELFKNARNTAAGSLRLKDSAEVAARKLDAILYQIGYAEDKNGNNITFSEIFKSHDDNLKLLSDLGFKTPFLDKTLSEDIDQIMATCLDWQDKRDNYPIDIDGMVIKVNNTKLQQIIGKTSHHPKWATAFKFKPKQGFSTLENVEFQVGRTGQITPVAKITPVQLMGVEISSISLHNEDFIIDKDIRLYDTVIVERAGDVIPYIVGSLPEKRNGKETKIEFPKNCPSCAHLLYKNLEESAWRCINTNCPAQLEEHLIHFVSKEAMNIFGFGEENVRTFLKENLISNIASIYKIDYEKVAQLEGWKVKSIQNLKEGIEQSKQNENWRLLVGLGIRHIGTTTAKMLAKQVAHLLDYANWNTEQFMQLEDVGPKVALSLQAFFSDESNIELLKELEVLGLNLKRTEQVLHSEKLAGKTFLFTGTLTQFSRDEAKILVENNGGKNLSAVSANLNYLVAGEKAGSKLTKAQKIESIQIIDEFEFLKMIE
ncbi:MAG TPA: NAD-dependent DNA ligase LigA [Chitinophagales bacterium]|nr:NAD-dependent DNA ligase LigA [Chitinophagales bacterium]MCB9074013.1 NAD-dependent DNA ligase LigA [Chitinophagales bacterium]HMU98951.1 NAD-dependent DNA ligase LigA [Chitinophagales bacterium]HMV02384.1 NAD-dependent DNA ligase LigA [Chitinophagales bacterium]HMW95324.1 NAD-dependent DNA ligase LigA [Chitinophagales bacterium]